jgi:hypothetical protein
MTAPPIVVHLRTADGATFELEIPPVVATGPAVRVAGVVARSTHLPVVRVAGVAGFAVESAWVWTGTDWGPA